MSACASWAALGRLFCRTVSSVCAILDQTILVEPERRRLVNPVKSLDVHPLIRCRRGRLRGQLALDFRPQLFDGDASDLLHSCGIPGTKDVARGSKSPVSST